MSIIENLLQLSLPAIIMLTGLVMSLLGMGSEIYKVKVALPTHKTILLILGIPLLFLGASLSVLLVWKDVFGALPQPPDQWFWVQMFNIYRVVRYLIVIAIGIIIYTIYWIASEKAYGIDAAFVNSTEYRANVRIDHRGGEPFNCIAKLEEVVSISKNGNRQIQNLDELNPDGRFFEWEDKNWNNKVAKNYPRVVRIAGINEMNSFDSDRIHFIFCGRTSPDLNKKCRYEITVGIYRLRGLRQIKMKSIKRIMQINSSGLSWEVA